MATFKSVVTKLGQASIAAAIQSGKNINIVEMAIGDGGGKPVEPVATQTQLVKEVYRTKLNSLKLDPKNANWVIAEAIISASVGGFWMREMGLYADDGVLIAVCNMADTYKPTLDEGSGRTQTLRMVISVTDTSTVTLTLDDSLIVATEEYVNDLLAAHEKSRNHPDGTLTAKGFVQLSSATDSENEKQAATPKAVKVANDNANSRLPSDGTAVAANKLATARKIAGNKFDGTQDISIRASDVGALPSDGTAVAANKLATARKIAGNAFDGTQDISIKAADVGAYPATGGQLNGSMNATGDVTSGDGRDIASGQDVIASRALYESKGNVRVYSPNNKPSANDVGALSTAGGDVEYINGARHFASKSGAWEGAGAYASQYDNGSAPFMVPYGFMAPQGFSQYHPIVKGILQTSGYGYAAAISLGGVTTGNNNFPIGVINITTDGKTSVSWSFDPANGNFYSPGDVYAEKNISAVGSVTSGGGVNAVNDIYTDRNIWNKGIIQAGSGVYDTPNVRVYSPNYRPLPAEIGAVAADTCNYAGFAAGDPQLPYMRNSNNNEVVRLARTDWVNSQTAEIFRWAGADLRNDIYNWVKANFVADVKVGPRVVFWSSIAGWSDAWENLIPAGAVNIASQTYNDNRVNRVVYAYVMKLINGNWYNVGG
ncbi:hypothetical protein A8A01_20970 [Ewingella americana]|nr:hypothetical protein A8A01_20970 [Ewingella americana]